MPSASGSTGIGENAEDAAVLSRLADALTLHAGGGEPIDDEEAFLDDLGIDPDTIEDAGEPPWLR